MNKDRFRTARPVVRLRAGRNDWYRIQDSSKSSPAEVWIYDEIGYVGITAQDFAKDFNAIHDSEITLHLDTPGGEVYDGINIYNTIRDHRAEVTVIVDAIAASAGSFILQAGDRRIMNRNSEVMIHDAHGLCIGNSRDMATMIKDLDRLSDNIASIYAEKAGGTVAQWRDLMQAESWYSAQEAVDAGLADEVVGKEAKARNDFDLSIFSYVGRDHAPAPAIQQEEVQPEVDPFEGLGEQLAAALRGAFV